MKYALNFVEYVTRDIFRTILENTLFRKSYNSYNRKWESYELIAQCTALSSNILKSFRLNASNC